MKIFVFGNPDLDFDSLPIRIISELKNNFPDISFETKDPNEEWEIPENLIVIDTVSGIDKAVVFDDIDDFAISPAITLHDFDAGTYLKYLKKLGKIKKIKIIGLPPIISEEEAVKEISIILRANLF